MSGKQKTFLSAKQVRARYGNISDMTLWRWLADAELGFPAPLRINDRRFWDEDHLDQFDLRQREAA